MSKVEAFLTPDEEHAIVEAIGQAEKNTSGEIRIHIENGASFNEDQAQQSSMSPLDRAVEVFHQLEMEKTHERNGVIIYVAVNSKQFAIYGDKGIHDKVADTFWDSTKETILTHFKNGNFKQGLIEGILKAGDQLQKYFPHQEEDTNELSNEISKG